MVKSASRPDDERTLLLLGLMQAQDRYGYELHDFIESNLHNVIELKKATAYQLLDRLEQHGFVQSRVEQQGQRPSRTVYQLTPEGQAYFQHLLTKYLRGQAPLRPAGTIALMFLEHLPISDVLPALRERLTELEGQIKEYEQMPHHTTATGAALAIARTQALLAADRAWLQTTIDLLSSQQTANQHR